MSKIDKFIQELQKEMLIILADEEKMAQVRSIVRKNFEQVHNEAVIATVIAENRKHIGKGSSDVKFQD